MYQEIVPGEVPGLNEEHFGLSKVEEGVIRVIWLDVLGNDHTLEDGTLAFGLKFTAQQEILDREDHIAIDSRELSAACFNEELVEGPVVLKVDHLTALNHSTRGKRLPFFKTNLILLISKPLFLFTLPTSCQATLGYLQCRRTEGMGEASMVLRRQTRGRSSTCLVLGFTIIP